MTPCPERPGPDPPALDAAIWVADSAEFDPRDPADGTVIDGADALDVSGISTSTSTSVESGPQLTVTHTHGRTTR